jgi:triphosphatase
LAKAEEITGIDCQTNAALGAAIILRARFEEMAALRETTLDFSSIDGVHDMRVAMRRLRNTVRDVRRVLKKKNYKHFNKQLKKMYDIVGDVRNEDVAVASLGKMRTKSDSEIVREGIDHLLYHHNESREAARDKLTQTLTAENFAELQEDLGELLAKSIEERDLLRDDKTWGEIGSVAVNDIIKKFCRLSDNLYTAYDFEALHQFRIASKRLRTALELFSSCWGDDIDTYIEQVAKMQLILGKVHDRDGWLTDLSDRLSPSQKKILIVDGLAAKWIAARLVKKRNKNYNVALKLWKEWQTDGFVDRLREIVLRKEKVGELVS